MPAQRRRARGKGANRAFHNFLIKMSIRHIYNIIIGLPHTAHRRSHIHIHSYTCVYINICIYEVKTIHETV